MFVYLGKVLQLLLHQEACSLDGQVDSDHRATTPGHEAVVCRLTVTITYLWARWAVPNASLMYTSPACVTISNTPSVICRPCLSPSFVSEARKLSTCPASALTCNPLRSVRRGRRSFLSACLVAVRILALAFFGQMESKVLKQNHRA